ncbi:MAG TPA: C25 family cysteine peptidase, partial [Bacteroidales bacterium]|nr:C25 family cysteine peptidase [Bacteroidales bacterium]
MKRLFLLVLLVIALTFVWAQKQNTAIVSLEPQQTALSIESLSPESFSMKAEISHLDFVNMETEQGTYTSIIFEGMAKPSNVGHPELPVINRLMEVPFGADVHVNIISYDEEIIDLNNIGITNKIIPVQASYAKNSDPSTHIFEKNELVYNTDEFTDNPLVETSISGTMRGVRIGHIQISPFSYNPVSNTLKIYNNLQFEIVFNNADIATTEALKAKYYSPDFDPAYKMLVNFQEPGSKDSFTAYPIKYVIVANRAFEATLQPFVEWKTKSGYNVIEAYTDVVGTSNTAIKSYLESLYNAGISGDPAPTYVLIIGDHSGNYSIPAFSGDAGSHVTDTYFGCYDGANDNIPDLYLGRISAESTNELQNALNKIVPYEMYTIPDGSYLNNCMLIAGVDGSYAKSHGDGTLYYGIDNYFNEEHGFSNIYAYYYALTSAPYNVMSSNSYGASADIKSKISSGVGFANYTAHCSHDGWADPSVSRSDIANFSNINEYPFMIGNCCLSFQFNQSDAFGEMVVYAENKGAVGYIGGSNSTYWNEDVYWGIGLTSISITQANVTNHTYNNTGQGVYDGIWHENGESFDEWFFTAGQMVYCGNLQVEASSSSLKEYYWEIYHCVGDPSLMPYMTEPENLSLSFSDPMVGETSLTVNTEPYTYVAISKDNVLLDAKWSGSNNSVTLTFPALTGDDYCVVGTKQDRAPYINESVTPIAPFPPVANFTGTPTTILEGQSVTFTDASQYATEWLWNFGDGQTSTEQNPVHTYTTAGTYTVSLDVANSIDGDNETKNNYITVNVNNNPPLADFIADQTIINIGGSINFTDLTANNPTAWDWTFEGGTPPTSTDQNPTGITYDAPGTYSVTLEAFNPHGDDLITKNAYITVNLPSYCDAG